MELICPHRFACWIALVVFLAEPAGADPSAVPETTVSDVIRTIVLHVGESTVLQSPTLVKQVSITDPKVADVQVVSPEQILLMAKAIGSTDLLVWNDQETVTRTRVEVRLDRDRLQAELRHLFPRSTLEIRQWKEVVLVSGTLDRAEQADQLHRFLDAAELNYVDLTRVAGVQQVQIQVRVAEVSRTAMRALGINAFGTGTDFFGASTIGPSNGGALNPINIGPPEGTLATTNIPFTFNDAVSVSPGVTLFGGLHRADLQVFLQALAENQYLRILAEPNLIALNGEEAEFLAGGEFPIPVVQGTSSGNGTSISIEYREFGVRLRFRPTVLGDGAIRFFVDAEVSELTDRGSVELQGFRIPAIVTRRATTTLRLNNGQTFAMAGLISQTLDARTSRVPGLGDLPVLGALFRSVRYSKGETELVVLVSVSLVEPMSTAHVPPLPGALHSAPSDWELYGAGKIEGTLPAELESVSMLGMTDLGLNQLRGPGAWATYGNRPSRPGTFMARPALTASATVSGKAGRGSNP